MARQSRSQRRARREEQASAGESQAGNGAAQPQQQPKRSSRAQRTQAIRPSAQPVKAQTGRKTVEKSGGARRFVAESWGELKKVEWPRQSQVIQGTVVVLVACIIVGLYIWVADLAFKRLVQDVFLR